MPADVNGVHNSYCSIEFGAGGLVLPDGAIKSINYRQNGERGHLRGTSRVWQGRTAPIVTPEGDMEIYQAFWKQYLLPLFSAAGALGFMEFSVPVTVTHAEIRNPDRTVVDTLYGVCINSVDSSNTEGTDPTVIRLDLDIMEIEFAGGYYATIP
jgi:hypothetical protein